ncbi:AfsR/SARP family transcriptional regulator [Streptomyces sp. NBC_01537]|uniref:AfsR/SARP family transcriptional regulator n=1 Tax=Streptomyces sp. NBC_01537 TaxID=2903896 RepID=UPI0038652D81
MTDGDISLGPSAPKQQQLLATLALALGHVVTMSGLIDELWCGVPPRSAVTAVQTYVLGLRSLMASRRGAVSRRMDPKKILITSRGGYRLDLGTGTVDADLFERAVDLGCQRLSEGHYAEASGIFRSGLRMWRGPALDGVPLGPRLALEVARLDELRLTAMEGQIEAELHTGRHRQVLSRLKHLTENHSLHEGFHAQLMLALHRMGRRGQALEVFTRLRTALRDELGIEPMPELQDLQQEILRGSAEKRWATVGVVGRSGDMTVISRAG